MPDTDKDPKDKDPTEEIARLEAYVNGLGQRVTAFVPFDGKDPRKFQGEAVLQAAGPQGRAASLPIVFPIEANTIQEAYGGWEAALKDMLRELNRPKIQVARLAQTPGNGGKRLG